MVRQLLIITGIVFAVCQTSLAIELDSDDDGKIDSEYVDAYTQDGADAAFQPDLDEYTQEVVEAGTSQTEGLVTPLRLRQAIAAYLKDFYGFGAALTAEPAGEYVGQTVLAAGYTAGWDPASQHDDSYDGAYWALCTATGSPGTWIATLRVNGEVPVQWDSETYDFTTDANCVAAYFMNADESSEIDRSSNGNNLTQNGTIPTSDTIPTYYSGVSRLFASADDPHDFLYRGAGDGGSTDLGATAEGISIVAWVRFTSVAADQVIVAKGSESGTDGSYILKFESSDGDIDFMLTSNATPTWTTATTTNSVSAETWYHVAAVYDKSTMQIYINGDTGGSAVNYSTNIYNNTGVFRIGSYGGAAHFDGNLDEVAVFSRALSAAEVAAIYTNGLKGDKGSSD